MTLVVGGAGFIGTNYINRFGGESFDRLDGLNALSYATLRAAMRRHDTVIHLAANADIAAGATNPNLDLLGIQITQCVAEAARETGIKRIIYLSGSGVYGHLSADWPTEDTPTTPISPYGASKLASEAILNAYSHMYGIDVTIFRPANVVGPHQTHGVGLDFLTRLRANPAELTILGDGHQSKQYLHVDDLLDAIDIAPPGTYNVAPADHLTVDNIAAMAIDHLNLTDVAVTHTGGLAWPGDIPCVRLLSIKLNELGWEARSSRTAMTQALAAL